jgi:hypothetical protein
MLGVVGRINSVLVVGAVDVLDALAELIARAVIAVSTTLPSESKLRCSEL